VLRRYASAYRPDRTFAAGKLGHLGGRPDIADPPKNFEALSLRRYHSRKRNVKPVPMA
jgi:hypothetical protein